MKNITLFSLFIFFFYSAFGQDEIQERAYLQAQKMTGSYNKGDIRNYVDYLLPIYYRNNPANKAKFAEAWEKILPQDPPDLEFIKILKLTESNNQYQGLFQYNLKDDRIYIIGVSNDGGNNWFFTQHINKHVKFDQLLETIPTLDRSFAEIIDPKYGKRVDYEIGELISAFNFTDINGNQLFSENLKGKAIVLNFWSIACPPCIKEIPELNKLVDKYKDENIHFIAPAAFTPEEYLKNKFLPEYPFSYDIVLIDGNDYVISTYPTHIVLNQKHEVVEIITGYSKGNIQKLERNINEIL